MRQISRRSWAYVLLSSALQILCFPIAGPVPVWRAAICWFALVPLLLALTTPDPPGAQRPGILLQIKTGAWLGYVSGILWYLGNCYWIYATMHTYGGIAKPAAAGILLLFCLYLGLYHALFGAVVAMVHRSFSKQAALALSPFAWVGVELARARITGFPWDLLGIAQIDNPVLTRLAPITGAYGLSFVIAAVNSLWLIRISPTRRRHMRTVLTAGGIAVVLLYAVLLRHFRNARREDTSAVATLVQENLEVGAAAAREPALTHTEMLESFFALSLSPPQSQQCSGIPKAPATRCVPASSAQAAAPAIIVWPEAPNDFMEGDPEFRASLSRLARAAHSPVIAGANGVTPDRSVPRGYDLYNSAAFIQADGGFFGRYDKMHLVPFGEYTPYKKLFFFAGSLLQDVGLYDPGKRRTMFSTGGHGFGTFICYESVFGDEVRQYAAMGADVLVNISDDGWYGDTSAAWEHLNQVRMRAIENHRWVLRATNTGVTAIIDPYGRVTAAVPRHIRTSLRGGFSFERDLTFYAAHGDLFAWFCAAVAGAALAGSLARSRQA